MYILKNAFQNLGRNKKRNILLGIILFALILSTTVSLVISTTTKEIINDYRNRFGSKVLLSIDFDKLMSESKLNDSGLMSFPSAPEIAPEKYLSFADSKLLKSYKMKLEKGIIFDKLKAVDENNNEGSFSSLNRENQPEYITPKAKLLGYAKVEDIPDFNEGLRKIISGDIFKNKNECIVSSTFAELNGLKVGSDFVIIDSDNKSNKITLKVVGIYVDATKENGNIPSGSMSLMGSYMNRRNEIIVSMDTMQEHFDPKNLMVEATYELLNPDLLKDFEKELIAKGLPSEYKATTDVSSYNSIVAPVVGLADISISFMIVILLVGGLVLLFVTNLVIQERKYEIGVLRAIGLKKEKVVGMIMAEIVMITVISLGFGLTVGSVISQPIANVLIEGQSKINQNAQGNLGSGFIGSISTSNNVEPLSEIKVSLGAEAITQIIFVALGLALLASASGVVFITKYEPMKILSERSQ